jgi:AraC family ethanolamine operon transcriptional activator
MRVQSAEDLREATRGSDIEIVQLRAGRQQGSLAHVTIPDASVSLCDFAIEVRARGVLSPDKIVLGAMVACTRTALFWGEGVSAGDIVTFPAGIEADAIYGSGSSYATITIDPAELESFLQYEGVVADPARWNKRRVHRANPRVTAEMRRGLSGIGASLQMYGPAASPRALDFVRRSIIEAFSAGLTDGAASERVAARMTGARLVREVEAYVDAAGDRPVHISELCSSLRVSRRSLHRAFIEALNMGPVGYLRRRRLSTIQTILKRSDPAKVTIAEIAFEHGFPEPSRFAACYRSFFGETPSGTRQAAMRQMHPYLRSGGEVDLAQTVLRA